jgi:hypothetical protein
MNRYRLPSIACEPWEVMDAEDLIILYQRLTGKPKGSARSGDTFFVMTTFHGFDYKARPLPCTADIGGSP